MTFEIEYQLVGTGWASCKLVESDSSCEITASYLSDALHNLVLAACAVCSGFKRISFSFDEEPGEFRWVFNSPSMNEIEVEILSFEKLWGDEPDSGGKSIFKARMRRKIFAQAVYQAAKSILDEYGEAGYLEKWSDHPFPSQQLLELSRLIETSRAIL